MRMEPLMLTEFRSRCNRKGETYHEGMNHYPKLKHLQRKIIEIIRVVIIRERYMIVVKQRYWTAIRTNIPITCLLCPTLTSESPFICPPSIVLQSPVPNCPCPCPCPCPNEWLCPCECPKPWSCERVCWHPEECSSSCKWECTCFATTTSLSTSPFSLVSSLVLSTLENWINEPLLPIVPEWLACADLSSCRWWPPEKKVWSAGSGSCSLWRREGIGVVVDLTDIGREWFGGTCSCSWWRWWCWGETYDGCRGELVWLSDAMRGVVSCALGVSSWRGAISSGSAESWIIEGALDVGVEVGGVGEGDG